jgi:HAD superfamily hydrolase (TIGR01549 family)
VGYDAVAFDLDGTLLERTQDLEAVYAESFEAVGVEPFGAPERLWPLLDGPPDPDDRVGHLGAGFARLAARHGRSEIDPLALAAAFLDAVDNAQVAFRPDAEAALTATAAAVPTGLLTNGPREAQSPKVAALDLAARVDGVVYAGDLPRRKPHAAPFARLLADLGTPAERTLYVGDSLAHDVAGAHNAGLAAAWLADGDDPDPYRPDHVLASIAEVPELVDA